MPRVIFKCPYIKPGTRKAAAHLSNYVRYMATRDGAEMIAQERSNMPATKKQQNMVAQLIRDYPLSRGLFEYEDYQSSPTCGNALEFISRALEDNYDQISKRENYVSYIAQRPRAERVGSHGLFSGADDPLVLSRISEEVANHPGNVWLPIISLRREDAARLGHDNAERWRTFLRSYAMEMAEAMKIPWDQFRWYAAFHDERHHPHVHMVCYSADGKSGFLTKEGIAKIRAGLAKEIFQQDLTAIYQRQTQQRDELVQKSGEIMRELIQQMRTGTLENPRIEQLTGQLAERLKSTSGKKQYGYLKAPLKVSVDEVVDELAKDPRIAAAYDLWYQQREEVLRTYKDDLPPRLPLSQQKEFKRIKNLVIQEAVRLGEYTEVFSPGDTVEQESPETDIEPDTVPGLEEAPNAANTSEPADKSIPAMKWNDRCAPQAKYRAAKRILTDSNARPEQIANAVIWLTQAAEAGLDYAQYALGKLYRDGGPVEQDPVKAVVWFAEAAKQNNQYAMYALGKIHQDLENLPAALRWHRRAAELGNQFAQYRLGKLLLNGNGDTKNIVGAVHWLTESAEQGNQYAQYALGKLYLLGKDVPQDRKAAVYWFTLASAQGNQYAQFFLDHMDDSPSLFASASRLLHHMGNIFREQTPPSPSGITFVDSKLRRKIREKKIAMGHRPDDHEEQGIQQHQ